MALPRGDRLMELPHQAKQGVERLLLAAFLIIVILAAYVQFSSATASLLAGRQDGDVRLMVLTKPAMYVLYNPVSKKVSIKNIAEKNPNKDYRDRVRNILKEADMSQQAVKYFVPRQSDQEDFWEDFKTALSSWRYNPLIAAKYAYDYLSALHERRTNLNLAEFLLYSMELSKLEVTDFAFKITPKKPARKRNDSNAAPVVEDRAPLAVEDRPIVVEILNGSGRRGAAQKLTQHLRDLNQKGLLRVDVLQYDNYPGGSDVTRVIDYSGRLMQVKQLSTAIGCKNEILSEPRGNAICDTRIIIGKDFEMPL